MNGRSHFSLGESLAEPSKLAEAAKSAGMEYLAISDTMTLAGVPEHVTACEKAGVKPVIGVRLRITPSLDRNKKLKREFYYLRAFVDSHAGLVKLFRLLSLGWDDDHFYEVPRLLLSDVLDTVQGGGVTLTLGDDYGAAEAGKAAEVEEECRKRGVPLYADLSGDLTPRGVKLARIALEGALPILFAPVALYVDAEQADSLNMMGAIARNRSFDALSSRRYTTDHVIKDALASKARWVHLAQALKQRYPSDFCAAWVTRLSDMTANTDDLAARLAFEWPKFEASLPTLASDHMKELTDRCRTGLKERLTTAVFGYTPTSPREYVDRLVFELGVIEKLGFASYMLLVADTVKWAKDSGIRVGPGRGSVGGSLIAYCLGITEVDPLRFGLLFERFINPDRIDLPDADLDFASIRREEVAEHLRARFGEDRVAAVANYNAMQAAGALKDVCRMLGVETSVAFGKLVPKEHGQSYSIAEALEEVADLAVFADKNPEVMKHAFNIEGKIRSYGRHAAGIVVAGVPIVERSVIEKRGGVPTICWDKRLAENFGLVKLDLLGLATLDMLGIATEQLAKAGVHLDLASLPLDDPKVLEAFGEGKAVGVFQFESGGMRRLLKDLAKHIPLTFEDLAAATALYRPGPMDSGLMDDFIKIRQGLKPVTYDHPSMESALRETQGVMVYQEQVMQVARDFAGFSVTEADHLRRAMGKKDKEKMATFRDKFVDGARAAHGVPDTLSGEIFDKISKFAAYGFNKSHAVAYTLLSYQTMYLKVHHPAEFWAGALTVLKEERRPAALADMRAMGISLLPPDINVSGENFEALNAVTVTAPMSSVKGVSARSTKAVLTERAANGPFASMADFEARVPARMCNVTQRGNLDKVGAFSRIEPGQLPPTHADRRRDQVELMPGLMIESVIVDQPMQVHAAKMRDLSDLVNSYRACDKCELAGLCHPKPFVRADAKFMVVVDAPSFHEEAADEMGQGSYVQNITEALADHGMTMDDVYITSLIKSPKPQGEKMHSVKAVTECPVWLESEINLLKPPVVLLLGSNAFRHFHKGLKGGLNEHQGRVIYDKQRDLNWVVGINPGAIYYDPSKIENLKAVFNKAIELLPL